MFQLRAVTRLIAFICALEASEAVHDAPEPACGAAAGGGAAPSCGSSPPGGPAMLQRSDQTRFTTLPEEDSKRETVNMILDDFRPKGTAEEVEEAEEDAEEDAKPEKINEILDDFRPKEAAKEVEKTPNNHTFALTEVDAKREEVEEKTEKKVSHAGSWVATKEGGSRTEASVLRAYMDKGAACGPEGPNANWELCGEKDGNCPDEIDLDGANKDKCPDTGKATLQSFKWEGLGQDVLVNGCEFIWYAEYVCKATTNTATVSAKATAECDPNDTVVRGKGKLYRGCQRRTGSGKRCRRWPKFEREKYPDAGLDRNYCRNPHNTGRGIWCYTGRVNGRWLWNYCKTSMHNH